MINKEEKQAIGMVLAITTVLLIGAGIWNWWKAGVQVEVYERQGVKMTQWEVFMGAKPVERVFIK